MRAQASPKHFLALITLLYGASLLGGCSWAGAEMSPKSPRTLSTAKPRAESLPIDSQLLATADAILAEGSPLKPGAGRRYSSVVVRADDAGRIQAYVYCERDLCEPVADALLDAGGKVELIRIRDARPVIQAWIPAGQLRAAAGINGVEAIDAPHYAHTR
jgi:hypothetical protein